MTEAAPRVIRILAGTRTDDIVAAAILHKACKTYGHNMLFPAFIHEEDLKDRWLLKSDLAIGRTDITVGIPLDADRLSPLLDNMKDISMPLYWDNHKVSYKYRSIKGTAVTIGESISASAYEFFSSVYPNIQPKKKKHTGLTKYLTNISNVSSKLSATMNLKTFLPNEDLGRRFNSLMWIYDPAQIFAAAFVSSEMVMQLANSIWTTKYMKLQDLRIDAAKSSMVPVKAGKYTVGIMTSNMLWPADRENACAESLKPQGEYDAVIFINMNTEHSGQVASVHIRTLHSEAEQIANRMAPIIGRTAEVLYSSQNRAEIAIYWLSVKLAGRSNFINKTIRPVLEQVYSQISNDLMMASVSDAERGYVTAQADTTEKQTKINKILNSKKRVEGMMQECLKTAKLDKLQDF